MIRYFKFYEGIGLPNFVELELTRDCNLKCYACNRRCRQAPDKNELSMESIEKFLKDCLNFKWHRIRLIGGEPTLRRDLLEIINILEPYCLDNECELELRTNGFGSSIEKLKTIPIWVKIINTEKITPAIWLHVKCDIAPMDYGIMISGTDGCHSKCSFCKYLGKDSKLDNVCGIVYRNEGYYVCGGSSAIDYILKFNLGYNTPNELIKDKGMKQYKVLCQYCGEAYKMQEYINKLKLKEWESPTWKKIFEEWKSE